LQTVNNGIIVPICRNSSLEFLLFLYGLTDFHNIRKTNEDQSYRQSWKISL